MQDDIKSFVLLKYEILTSDNNTWKLCETYPLEVRSKWAWRCASDVEHLAKEYPKAEECIRVAKAHRDGTATKRELDKAFQRASTGIGAIDTIYAASSSAYVAACKVEWAVDAACYAVVAFIKPEEKWKQYISWLIEELCEYEANHAG
jgi:hypothetical protein